MLSTDRLDDHLRRERAGLLAFVRARIADPDAAEDLLQESLLRAVRAAPDLRDEERLTAWLYGIVRNAVTDHYRRRGVRTAAHERLVAETQAEAALPPEDEARACACLVGLLPTLKPEYQAVVAADLNGEGTEPLAARLGITPNNLKVRRHRAHRQLRERLEATCKTCATHGCVDCSCGSRE